MSVGFFRENLFILSLVAVTLLLLASWLFFVGPRFAGDTESYVEAMGVMVGLPAPEGFTPFRILTTLGGMGLVLAFAPVFGLMPAWLLMNMGFFVMLSLASFFLFRTIFENERVAFLGALFVIGNYAPLVFGLNYLMDAGGWAFYVLSLFFVARFVLKGSSAADILWGASAVGIGGLFKEYALLGCIAIAIALLWYASREPRRAISLMAVTAGIALVPVALVHFSVYQSFGYTYLDWIRYNSEAYVYSSRFVEFVKALGSLVNLLAPLAFLGAWIWVRESVRGGREQFLTPQNIAVLAVAFSALPVFFWGGITQRVLFVLVPASVLAACFLFQRHERQWPLFLFVAVLYIGISFYFDALLAGINIPL